MKTSESIAVAMVSLFEAGDSCFLFNPERARKIFVPVRSKLLAIATAMACALFTNIHQKFSSAELTKLIGPDPKRGHGQKPQNKNDRQNHPAGRRDMALALRGGFTLLPVLYKQFKKRKIKNDNE